MIWTMWGGNSPFAGLTSGANAALAAVLREAAATGLAFNHQTGEYWLSGVRSSTFEAVSGASMTRASTGYATTLGGVLVPFGANVLRRTDAGALIEGSATNLFLQSAVGATQSVTVTAVAHTLSFYGAGSIVLSGAGAGTLNGTGENNRVSLTFTPSAGALTLTVTGSCVFVQLETGSRVTSYIPTTTAAATRAADFASVPFARGVPFTVIVVGQASGVPQPNDNPNYIDFTRNSARETHRVNMYDGGAVSPAIFNALIRPPGGGGSSRAVSGLSAQPALRRAAHRVTDGENRLCVNGILSGAGADVGPTLGDIVFLQSYAGATGGALHRIHCIVPRALSDAELQAVTA